LILSAIRNYVASMNKRMVDAIKGRPALGAASELLYVGTKDWHALNNWEKINVSSE